MSYRGKLNASHLISVAALAVGTAFPNSASATEAPHVLDGRFAYPLVLNSGPADSRYEGSYMIDFLHFLKIGSYVGFGLSVEYIRLSNRVPANGPVDTRVDAYAVVVPFHVALPLIRGGYDSVWDDLLLDISFGTASRSIGNVHGLMLAGEVGAEITWYLHPIPGHSFIAAPTVAFEYISEARKSSIGYLCIAILGLRIGWRY